MLVKRLVYFLINLSIQITTNSGRMWMFWPARNSPADSHCMHQNYLSMYFLWALIPFIVLILMGSAKLILCRSLLNAPPPVLLLDPPRVGTKHKASISVPLLRWLRLRHGRSLPCQTEYRGEVLLQAQVRWWEEEKKQLLKREDWRQEEDERGCRGELVFARLVCVTS